MMAEAQRQTRAELVELLSASVGYEKAAEAILESCRQAGHSGDEITREDALRVLELVAKTPGIVGITARFAKTRVLLKWK
jgi:hypothetical protein